MSWEDYLKQIEWDVTPVECDDYDDTYWNYHVVYKLDGREVWDDYYHSEPDGTRIYNNLSEAFTNDAFPIKGKYRTDYYMEELKEKEKQK